MTRFFGEHATNASNALKPSIKAVADAVEKGQAPEPSALNNYQKVPLEDSRRMSQQEIWRECFREKSRLTS